jgi:beta-glucanase (GH16 family)
LNIRQLHAIENFNLKKVTMKNSIKYQLIFFGLLCLSLSCKKNSSAAPAANPSISIESATNAEGNSGTTAFNFSVKLSKAATATVAVSFMVTAGLAKEGSDYTLPSSSTVSFAPGETQKNITINIIADDIREADEDFSVTLSNASGATVAAAIAKGNITNDDTRVPFANAGYSTPSSYPGMSLTWSDEFDGTALNANNWVYDIGTGCPSLCGWGNNELQYYTNSPNNVFVQNGSVIIESRKENIGGKEYSSGRIKTDGKQSFKFGRIDIRAISPYGRGIWPALWMMPQNNVYGTWPNSGEIDIMEVKGHDTKTAYQTVHYGPGPPSTFVSKTYTLTNGNLDDSFHVYSLAWTMDTLRLLVDDVEINKVTKTDLTGRTYPFNENFFFILCTAVGGNFPGAPDASSTYPQWLIVDYVRVFQ